MRVGLIITGVLLLLFGVAIVVAGAPILGLGGSADAGCRDSFFGCDQDQAQAGAMFVSLGIAMLAGGGIIALTGIGLLIAGIVSEAKPRPAAVPVAATTSATIIPVQMMRPCPSCEKSIAVDAKYCGQCGAAVSPMKPRLTP